MIKLHLNLFLFRMIKKKVLVFLLIFILIDNCSFVDTAGIWDEGKQEKKRISRLEKAQKQSTGEITIYTSHSTYLKEISLSKNISLSEPKKNSSWKMSGLNHQNFLGNIYLPGIDNIFLKKKIGKNKFSISNTLAPPIMFKNNIILSDNRGTIFNINDRGEIIWKKNLYKNIHKKVYKNLNFSIYQNKIYVLDNIGFIYAISLDTGTLVWIKNHKIPLKSNMKIFENKIFLMDQENRLLCLNAKDGSKIWDVRSISSFIKSQGFLSLALSKQGDVISINSSADLFKTKGSNGNIYWSLNTSSSTLVDATDFFKSSEIVIDEDIVIFSAGTSIFSYNLNDGVINWQKKVSSAGTPIIDGENIFLLQKMVISLL